MLSPFVLISSLSVRDNW